MTAPVPDTPAPAGAGPAPGLRGNADFLRLWAGESVSVVGSAVTDLALLTFAVLQLGASAAQVGLLLACSRLPFPLLNAPCTSAPGSSAPRSPSPGSARCSELCWQRGWDAVSGSARSTRCRAWSPAPHWR